MENFSEMAESLQQQRTALVLYGSETGNAQDIAQELGRVAQRLRFSSLVTSLDSVEPASFASYTLVLIAISTTGQGGFPASSRSFWKKLLRRKLPNDYLSRVNFALFGLGDSSYPKFNWAALKLFKRLVQLGANAIVEKGEGDEQHPEGIDSIFLPWLASLKEKTLETFPLSQGLRAIDDQVLLQPQWLLGKLSTTPSHENGVSQDTVAQSVSQASGHDLDVTLESNKRLTPDTHWQDVRHLIFQASQEAAYDPGDILTIYPENPKSDVDQVISLLGWQDVCDVPVVYEPNTSFEGVQTMPKTQLSGVEDHNQITLRHLLTHHLDLNAIPRRSFFSLILRFTDDEFQKLRLQEFTDPQYTDELFDYTTRPRRSILEVLQEFDTLQIPWQWATAILPPLRGRQFSIASGGSLRFDDRGMARFELLVAIVKYKTVIRKIRRGTCTRYLDQLPEGSKLRVTLVKGSLGVNRDQAKQPIVMIGPGTGVAPMRSLIHQRLQWLEEATQKSNDTTLTPSEALAKGTLFFGCRNKSSDFFFQEEWSTLPDRIPLEVIPAFSRDHDQKVYVQDLIKERKEDVFHLLHDLQGIVYVCGSSGKMPEAVREALIEAFEHGLASDRGTATAYLKMMEKQSRYKQETW